MNSVIIILLVVNLLLLCFVYFWNIRKSLNKHEVSEDSPSRTSFAVQIAVLVFVIVVFGTGVIHYFSFSNQEEEFKQSIRQELRELSVNCIGEINQQVLKSTDSLIFALERKLDSLFLLQGLQEKQFRVVQDAFRSDSRRERSHGPFFVSRYKIEVPAVGYYDLAYGELGIGINDFDNPPSVFIQEHGAFHAYATKITTKGIQLRFSEVEERFIYISLLLYSE